MRPARIAAVTLAALVGLALLLVVAAWVLARTEWAAAEAALRASAVLGQPVRLAGLTVRYFPLPSVELRRLEVGPDDAGGPLLVLERGVVGLRWGELGQAPTALRALELEGLTLRPRVDAQGHDNWTALVERVMGLAGTGPAAFAIGRLTVEGGRVDYADAALGRRFALTSLALEADDVVPARAFPLSLRLAGEAADHVFHLALEAEARLDPDHSRHALAAARLRGWIGGGVFGAGGADLAGGLERTHVDLAAQTAVIEGLDFDAFGLRGRARAAVAGLLEQPSVRFGVETEPFAPRAVANAFGQPLPATTDPAALGQAVVALDGRYGVDGLALGPIAGRLDDTAFSGSLRVPPSPAQPTLELALDAIDLDRYLPPGSGEPVTPAEGLGALLASVDALAFEAAVEVERASVAGAVARGLRVTVEPSQPAGSSP